MDDLIRLDATGSRMPPEAPLPHPRQSLATGFTGDGGSTAPLSRPRGMRWLTFASAILTTAALLLAFTHWAAADGLIWLETALIGLTGLTFFWIALSLATVTTGLLSRRAEQIAASDNAPLTVALVVPIHQEDAADVFGNARAMLDALAAAPSHHAFTLYFLSDTRDPVLAEAELRAFAAMDDSAPIPVHYRRRAENTDAKVGNLSDWVSRWGGRHDAMIVLDADSLMGANAIVDLTDALAGDPNAGLIQSFPRLYGAKTLFARMQQFASAVYGMPLAEGLAAWTDREGNYWGHNAIIRVPAFAACAGLPAGPGGGLILSHDFVEAGLLRRAGWSVRFLPRIAESYEEVPPTLIDYIIRDRRWCRGNLQHLRLLGAKGFASVSRFHLFQGAMAYLLSLAWFGLLLIWALLGEGSNGSVVSYFSGENPQVTWPRMNNEGNAAFLIFMYSMLLAPKAMAALSVRRFGRRYADLGGPLRFVASLVTEIVGSILFAPIMMVQQTQSVLRAAFGQGSGWKPQVRNGTRLGWTAILKFHAVETALGLLLTAGMFLGLVSWWLSPVVFSLLMAVPLSRLSGLDLRRVGLGGLLGTEDQFNAPEIIRSALHHRQAFRHYLDDTKIAAE